MVYQTVASPSSVSFAHRLARRARRSRTEILPSLSREEEKGAEVETSLISRIVRAVSPFGSVAVEKVARNWCVRSSSSKNCAVWACLVLVEEGRSAAARDREGFGRGEGAGGGLKGRYRWPMRTPLLLSTSEGLTSSRLCTMLLGCAAAAPSMAERRSACSA